MKNTALISCTIAVGLGLARSSSAEPRDSEPAPGSTLSEAIHLKLPATPPRAARPPYLETPQVYRGTMSPSPELDVVIDPHPLLQIRVGAPLDDELPRLDTVAVESYWYVETRLNLTPRLRLFVQDFQLAVREQDELVFDEPPDPDLSWDGHQVSFGVEVDLAPRWKLRAAPVLYTLSLSGRPDDWGARVGLHGTF